MDIRDHNRRAWNKQVEQGNQWTLPVGPDVTEAARRGAWSVLLTPTIPVPREWFGDLNGKDVLCLASGGGQQGPVLAAAGAHVTVYDNSPRQLASDRLVAERDGLEITTIEGDMRDLSVFETDRFDLIFHPVSNTFVPDVRPVWREAFRVLRPGGVLLAGFTKPFTYIFDFDKMDQGILEVKNKLPYSDLTHLDPKLLEEYIRDESPLEWSHSLDDQIGGQTDAGFHIIGFYEDYDPLSPLSAYITSFIATLAVKP